jgi:hypothetical protein
LAKKPEYLWGTPYSQWNHVDSARVQTSHFKPLEFCYKTGIKIFFYTKFSIKMEPLLFKKKVKKHFTITPGASISSKSRNSGLPVQAVQFIIQIIRLYDYIDLLVLVRIKVS